MDGEDAQSPAKDLGKDEDPKQRAGEPQQQQQG
jgi:hypothetical protein